MTEEGVLVLEPGDERAKKIGKAMASTTASDVLSTLSENELTLSELSEQMGQPITTLKYQIENLLDAGLVDIVRTRYSEKGRVVKVYGLRQQVVIMSPGKADVRSLLLKYASLFALIICASLVLFALAPTLGFLSDGGLSGTGGAPDGVQVMTFSANETDGAGGINGEKMLAEPRSAPVTASLAQDYLSPAITPNILAVMFFTGGFVAIFAMLLFELVAMYRRK
ncbi:ArsR/SmtB family transcription factor [Methanogenium cariaci]|jgi:DNA-binding transcriptional ArsR family regulator